MCMSYSKNNTELLLKRFKNKPTITAYKVYNLVQKKSRYSNQATYVLESPFHFQKPICITDTGFIHSNRRDTSLTKNEKRWLFVEKGVHVLLKKQGDYYKRINEGGFRICLPVECARKDFVGCSPDLIRAVFKKVKIQQSTINKYVIPAIKKIVRKNRISFDTNKDLYFINSGSAKFNRYKFNIKKAK